MLSSIRRISASRALVIAAGVWCVAFVVIAVMAFVAPTHRSVTPVYKECAEHWAARQPIYRATSYWYNYLPHPAIVYRPFSLMPDDVAGVLWRALCIGLYASAVWRLAGLGSPADRPMRFLLITLLALPVSLSSMRNGQANTPLAAMLVHACVDLAYQNWTRGAIWMALALGLKQIAIAMILLAVAWYVPLIVPLIVALLVVAAFPFMTAPPQYVLQQYGESILHMRTTISVAENRFADIAGILRAVGIEMSATVSIAVRVAAAFAMFVAWRVLAPRLAERERAMLLLALSALFAVLFNPMSESNAYIIAAPILADYAVRWRTDPKRRVAAWLLAAGLIAIGLLPELLRRPVPDLSLWLKPCFALMSLVIIVAGSFRREPPPPSTAIHP